MRERKVTTKRERIVHKIHIRRIALVVLTFLVVIAPLNAKYTKLLPGAETIVAQAIGIGLIGGATTNSDYNNGKLSIGIHGGAALSVDVGKNYYAQVRLPSSLAHLLENPDVRDHIVLKYSIPAPLLGFIPIRGEVKGENLLLDKTNSIIQGGVMIPLNLSLAGVYRFTFEIDVAALGESIPLDTYEFKITAGDTQLDIPLLELKESKSTLTFQHLESGGEQEENVPVVGNAETNTTVLFLPSSDSPPIVDPTNPKEPYEPGPTDPQDPATGETGSLTLDYVSSIDFGQQEISGEKKSYKSTILRPFIQVTDRRGTGAGWIVTAAVSEFNNNATEESLIGSVIRLKGGTTISPGNSDAPYPYKNIRLKPGGEADLVLWADPDTGRGTWVSRWYPSTEEAGSENDNVILEVPAGAATVGEHEAVITWTLIAAPGQEPE